MQRTAKNMQAAGLEVVLFLAAGLFSSFAQTSVESRHTSTPPPATAFAPEEVAARSSEVTNLLISFSEKFALDPEIEKIRQAFPEISRQIDLDSAETAVSLGEHTTLTILEAQRIIWQRRLTQVSTWLTLLTHRAVELQGDLARLSQMKVTWIQTPRCCSCRAGTGGRLAADRSNPGCHRGCTAAHEDPGECGARAAGRPGCKTGPLR